MQTASRDRLEQVLDASLRWHRCATRAALQREISRAFEDWFAAQVAVEILHEARARDPRSAASGSRQETSERVVFPHPCRCLICAETAGGETIEVMIQRRCRAFSPCERHLQCVAGAHLATAFAQVSRLEDLQSTVHDLEASGGCPSSPLPLERLTPTELEVAAGVGRGLSNAGIAEARGGSRRTVEKHLESIYAKLGLENRYQLMKEMADATA